MVDILKMLVELDNAEITGILLMILFFVYIVVIYTYKILSLNKRSNLEELQIKRDIIENKEEKTNDLELIDEIIDFDVSNEHIDNKFNIEDKFIYKLLKLHHEQALKQSNIQFWFSILASVVGFGFIIIIVITSNDSKWYEYILKTLPGIIIETISILFINQARETRDKATKFFTELNYQMQIEKSVEIADTIERDEIRSEVKSKIALHIIGVRDDIDRRDDKIKY